MANHSLGSNNETSEITIYMYYILFWSNTGTHCYASPNIHYWVNIITRDNPPVNNGLPHKEERHDTEEDEEEYIHKNILWLDLYDTSWPVLLGFDKDCLEGGNVEAPTINHYM